MGQYLTTVEAASMLGVTPYTLREWERRFGFPAPRRGLAMRRQFRSAEIVMLRSALEHGLSVSSAIARVLAVIAAENRAFRAALISGEPERAEFAMEVATAGRSVEDAVHDVLLPALTEIFDLAGRGSAVWSFAAGWASEWLRQQADACSLVGYPDPILVIDGSLGAVDPVAAHIRALELYCARSGVVVQSVPSDCLQSRADALASQPPMLLVIAGGRAHKEIEGQPTAALTVLTGGKVPIAGYRVGDADPAIPASDLILPDDAGAATERILALVHQRSADSSPRQWTARRST